MTIFVEDIMSRPFQGNLEIRHHFLKQLKCVGLLQAQLLHFYTGIIRPVLEYAAPVWRFTKFGDRSLNSFSSNGPRIWNTLPLSMISLILQNSKRSVKSHFLI